MYADLNPLLVVYYDFLIRVNPCPSVVGDCQYPSVAGILHHQVHGEPHR